MPEAASVRTRLSAPFMRFSPFFRTFLAPIPRPTARFDRSGGDLETLTGRSAEALEGPAVKRHRHIEISSVVDIDAIGKDAASRMTNVLLAAVKRAAGGRPARAHRRDP
ncbi:MAG: hypothetical protein WDN01_16585 [Rhizomicrobium sp.]